MTEKHFYIEQDVDDICDKVRLDELNLEMSNGTNMFGNIFSCDNEIIYEKIDGQVYISLNFLFAKFFHDEHVFESIITNMEGDKIIQKNNCSYIDKCSAIFVMLHATKDVDKLLYFFSKLLNKIDDGEQIY